MQNFSLNRLRGFADATSVSYFPLPLSDEGRKEHEGFLCETLCLCGLVANEDENSKGQLFSLVEIRKITRVNHNMNNPRFSV